MHRKWKSVFALGMALLLGCLMPVNTMLAADDETEVVQEVEADSDIDEVSDDEAISDDNESADAEENTGDEADADMDGQEGIQLMSVTEEPEAGGVEVQTNTDAPVISIKWNDQDCTYDLGGNIDYKYVNNPSQTLECSASQNDNLIKFYFYLDNNPGVTSKEAGQIDWSRNSVSPVVEALSSNKTYVLYVKAEANGQTVYARSCGVVVDTIAPKIVGVEEGNTYPAGTTFTVEDANLDVVMVNESPATPASDGSYKVKANGTNCMIRVKDKAGNEETCSITVFGEEPPEDPVEDPKEDTVISASGIYSLKPGVSYQLAAGKWQVGGDSTVYQGGRTFYVRSSGDYSFTKQ